MGSRRLNIADGAPGQAVTIDFSVHSGPRAHRTYNAVIVGASFVREKSGRDVKLALHPHLVPR